MNRPLQPPQKPPQTGSLLPIGLAGCLATMAGVALVFLTLGFAGQIIAVALVLFAVVAFHYVVWGRWLGAMIRAEVQAEEAKRLADQADPPASSDEVPSR